MRSLGSRSRARSSTLFVVRLLGEARITSYNVCYTKLLRLLADGDTLEIVQFVGGG